MTKQEKVYRADQIKALRDGAVLKCRCGYPAMKTGGTLTFGDKYITIAEYVREHTPAVVKFRGVR